MYIVHSSLLFLGREGGRSGVEDVGAEGLMGGGALGDGGGAVGWRGLDGL